MTEILKKLMNARCVSMHNPNMRCSGKGCDGQCAQFQLAIMELEEEKVKASRAAVKAYADRA